MSKPSTKLLLVLIFITNCLVAQRYFRFNNPGVVCYSRFIAFTNNNNYSDVKKPTIFVYGEQDVPVENIFSADTLHLMPEFSNYLFYFIPNDQNATNKEKLKCFQILSSYLTYNFSAGHQNLFLVVKDKDISRTDVQTSDIKNTFRSVQLESEKIRYETLVASGITDTSLVTKSIVTEFKEDLTAYANAQKNEVIYYGPAKTFNFNLSGKIIDANTGEGLPFASISLKGKPVGTLTNADGQFTFIKVPTDTTTLLINYLGYKKTEYKLSPTVKKDNLVILVQALSTQLEEVSVVTEKEDLMNVSENLSLVKMAPSKLNQLPNVGEKDIMRFFQLMPGVSGSNESSSGLFVRGGTPDQNLVVYDGITIYQVDHLYGFYSAFNSNAIKDVQLYKGGFESKFGGRLSSVTEITGKDGNANNFNVGGDLSLLSMNAYVEAPIGKNLTFIAAGRRSFKGPLYNKIFTQFNSNQNNFFGRNNNSLANTVTSYFYDLNSKLTYKPNSKDILSLSVYNGTDKLDNSRTISPRVGAGGSSFAASITDLTRYGNTGLSFKWARKWNSRIYGNTLVSFSNYFSKRDRSNASTITSGSGVETTRKFGTFENNNLLDYSLKSDYIFDITNNNQLSVGIWGTYYDIAYNYSQNDTSTILNRHNYGVLSGAYVQDKFKFIKNKLVVMPGIRTSYYSVTDKLYYEPRFFSSYNFTKKLSLKVSTGKFYQFANQITREDILNGNKTFWILSDGKNVPVSQAIHYISGISYDAKNYLFSIEGWYKDLSGLTEHSIRFNNNLSVGGYSENFFQGIGYSKGVELLAQKKFGKFSGWISYTRAQTRSKFLVYSNDYYAANQDVTNEFKIIGIYKYKQFVFSSTWIYATGRPYTAPSGAYSINLLDGNSQDFFTVSSKNSLRLPDYHRMDISISYMFKNIKGNDAGSFGLSIFNVYNRLNTWYKEFQISDKQIIETDIRYLGFTPNVTLSLKLR